MTNCFRKTNVHYRVCSQAFGVYNHSISSVFTHFCDALGVLQYFAAHQHSDDRNDRFAQMPGLNRVVAHQS